MNDSTLEHLNFPDFSFRVREQGQSKQIFDSVRKRFVALTPEEWVRQNLIQFMVQVYRYPLSLMAVEKIVKVNGLSQRADVVIYDRSGAPWLIAECKAPSIKISQETFLHFSLQVAHVLLTNGNEHYCLKRSEDQFEFMESLPEFEA